MITLTEDQINFLKIKRFVFHVVHHGESEPILFDELEVGEFEPFFIDRIKSVLNGTAYEFNAQSEVCTILESISNSPGLFVDKSRQLAVNFHAHCLEDKRIKKGVMILIQLEALDRELFAIVKFEHEQVLRYNTEGIKVFLENVTDTFTQSPEAMQKAALIDISEEHPGVMVVDRNVRNGISGFFQGFLNVRRKKNEKEMTEDLFDVVKETTKKHEDELPREFAKELQQKTDEYFQNSERFDNDQFYDTVFGSHSNEGIQNTYRHCLAKHEIDNEQFFLDKEAMPAKKKAKIKTAEGVTIYFDDRSIETIKVSYGKDGEKDVIIIESSKIKEEYI